MPKLARFLNAPDTNTFFVKLIFAHRSWVVAYELFKSI